MCLRDASHCRTSSFEGPWDSPRGSNPRKTPRSMSRLLLGCDGNLWWQEGERELPSEQERLDRTLAVLLSMARAR